MQTIEGELDYSSTVEFFKAALKSTRPAMKVSGKLGNPVQAGYQIDPALQDWVWFTLPSNGPGSTEVLAEG